MSSLRSSGTLRSSLGGIAACLWLALAVMAAVPLPAGAQAQEAPGGADTRPQPSKAVTETLLAASTDTSEVGSEVTFTAVVKGAGGTPTGTVAFKDGETILGSAELSDGRASLATSALPAGQRAITATYAGDAAFEGSESAPALFHDVTKAATTVTLTMSSTDSEAGQSVTLTAVVKAAVGVPEGTVTFREGDKVLHSAELSEGRAQWTPSDLAPGEHTITAAYDGDDTFGPDAAQLRTYIRQSMVLQQNLPAVLIPLAAIIILALLALFRRLTSRLILRPLSRWLRALSRGLRRVLRLGRRARPRERPFKSLLGQSVGGMVFTETEDAIAKGFDKSSVQINQQFRLGCSWIQPMLAVGQSREDAGQDSDGAKEDADKTKEDFEKARQDFEKARQVFRTDVPIDSNPLNLYEDIHNAFVVNLFGRSDKPCFYVLSEFGKVISANVFCLATVFSSVVTMVAAVIVLGSGSIPFHRLFGLDRLPAELQFLGIDISPFLDFVRASSAGFDSFVFSALSCLLGFLALLVFYQLAYQQLQTLNGQQMNNFLNSYLYNIEVQFSRINASANAAIIENREAEEMRAESVMWITNLQWMAWRVFFIEEFLRNIMFQVRRDSIYSLALVPLVFVLVIISAVVIAATMVPGSLRFDYSQHGFLYLLFPILLYWCYRYLVRSLAPVSDSLTMQWTKFRQLDMVRELNRIMGSYAGQLDLWRTRFQGPGSQ